MQRYIPSEHAAVLVAIPMPRIKTPVVKRKRYESIKTIKTHNRAHDARFREHCAPSMRTRREIRWLTMETPTRWTTALTIVSAAMGVRWVLQHALGHWREGRVMCVNGEKCPPVKSVNKPLILYCGLKC